MATTVHEILDQFREDARNNRDLGDLFERLMVRYFELDPLYADRFSKIWMWNDWPDTRDKASGIVNDPNDWCSEHNQPRYIIDLVKRIVRVSIETMNIVRSLPSLNER